MQIDIDYVDNPDLVVRPINDNSIYDPINIAPELPQHPFLCFRPAPCAQ